MKLRMLEKKDAPLMLEWMHDKNVVGNLQTDFNSKNINDCLAFIEGTKIFTNNVHRAIVNEDDEYMGTVSLKNIFNKTAEFAIAIRTCAMGKGYSSYAMKEILHMGFGELGLEYIYWCVDTNNKRAIKFYDKNNYQRVKLPISDIILEEYTHQQIQEYLWYQEERKNN